MLLLFCVSSNDAERGRMIVCFLHNGHHNFVNGLTQPYALLENIMESDTFDDDPKCPDHLVNDVTDVICVCLRRLTSSVFL